MATIYSDAYKLGLLALRLLAGDHDTKNLQHIPSTAPALLRQVITDTLSKAPQQRPLPEAWNYVLGNAIEHAQHQQKTATPTPTSASAPPSTTDADRSLQTLDPPVSPIGPTAATDRLFQAAGRRMDTPTTEPAGLLVVQDLGRRQLWRPWLSSRLS